MCVCVCVCVKYRYLSNKIKRYFFQAVAVSILLYGFTRWTLIKHMEKKLDKSCTKMLRAVLNNSWKQQLTKQQLYGHLLRISQTIQVRNAGPSYKSRDKHISNVRQLTPTWIRQNGRISKDLHQLCANIV